MNIIRGKIGQLEAAIRNVEASLAPVYAWLEGIKRELKEKEEEVWQEKD